MNKILLIDGHNFLFQTFYGIPSRTRYQNGLEKQSVVNFVGSLNKLTNLVNPTHLLIVFDGHDKKDRKKNDRKKILAEYKANREDYFSLPKADNPLLNLPYIYEALDFLEIKYVEVSDDEADDIIASYCFQYGNHNKILIASHDSDFLQLINENISIIKYNGKRKPREIINQERFINEYSFMPNLYADYKAMVGDKSDNIKGVKGIGSKTATRIVNTYGNVKSIFNNYIEDDEIIQKLIENKEVFERNFSLIHLDNHAFIPFELNEIEFHKKNRKAVEVASRINIS